MLSFMYASQEGKRLISASFPCWRTDIKVDRPQQKPCKDCKLRLHENSEEQTGSNTHSWHVNACMYVPGKVARLCNGSVLIKSEIDWRRTRKALNGTWKNRCEIIKFSIKTQYIKWWIELNIFLLYSILQ